MKRILFVAPILLLLAAFAAPELQAQQGQGPRRGQGQQAQLKKRDGSRTTPGQCQGKSRGQGVRKQDSTGPRAGTAACPKTPTK